MTLFLSGLHDCSEIDLSGKGWTASSTNTWVNQPILPCQRLGCMQGNSLLTTMDNFGYKSTCGILLCRRGEVLSAPRVFLVLKRSFTVSLSSLDVLFGSGWCFCFVCLGFVPVFVLLLDIQSFAFSPALQQLEIS